MGEVAVAITLWLKPAGIMTADYSYPFRSRYGLAVQPD